MSMLAFVSCDKGDVHGDTLYGGSGIWQIESIHYVLYDTLGVVQIDSIVEMPGEFIFFSSSSSAGFGYYPGIFIDSATNKEYILDYRIDKYRMSIINYDGPNDLARTYNVEKFGSRKQTWVYLETYPDLSLDWTIKWRMTLTMSKTGQLNN